MKEALLRETRHSAGHAPVPHAALHGVARAACPPVIIHPAPFDLQDRPRCPVLVEPARAADDDAEPPAEEDALWPAEDEDALACFFSSRFRARSSRDST